MPSVALIPEVILLKLFLTVLSSARTDHCNVTTRLLRFRKKIHVKLLGLSRHVNKIRVTGWIDSRISKTGSW